jgi:hypothetical protein
MKLFLATTGSGSSLAEIETEYREVLARPKFNVSDAIQLSWRAFIEEVTIRVEPSSHPAFPAILKTSSSLPQLLRAKQTI